MDPSSSGQKDARGAVEARCAERARPSRSSARAAGPVVARALTSSSALESSCHVRRPATVGRSSDRRTPRTAPRRRGSFGAKKRRRGGSRIRASRGPRRGPPRREARRRDDADPLDRAGAQRVSAVARDDRCSSGARAPGSDCRLPSRLARLDHALRARGVEVSRAANPAGHPVERESCDRRLADRARAPSRSRMIC